MTTSEYIAALGILLNTGGTFLFAWEAIRVFRQTAFEVKHITYEGKGSATKTPEFIRWDTKRIRAMFGGLVLVVVGNLIQIASMAFF